MTFEQRHRREPFGCEDTMGDDETFVADVRAAIDSGEVFVAYQPIVELRTARLQKVEALARWTHPVHGLISPCEFIPRAEQTGAIHELGAWILERACCDIVELRAHGIDIDLNVNLSVVQLRRPGMAERTAEILARCGLAPERVWIELTESVFVDDEALGPLVELHDLGVHLVIDDFGTGFSNFQYISRLPVSGFKIDRSFVAGLGVNVSDTAIVRSMANLGRELGLQIVVEGVETESQRSQLQAFNCRLAQGWLFAPALRPAELVAQFGPTAPSISLPTPVQSVDETARIAALRACKVLDTVPEPAFDVLARMAAELLETPMALISLVDVQRQWFKASVGLDISETSREVAFCNHAIADPLPPFVVADAARDERFAQNPLVIASPSIRAYAGAPILSREDLPLGTLCVLDTHPRDFTPHQLEQLTRLASQAAALLDLRRRAEELNDLLRARGIVAAQATSRQLSAADIDGEDADGDGCEVSRLIQCGALTIDTVGRQVTLNGRVIEMTSKEFELLIFLAEHVGEAFSRSALLEQVWKSSPGWQSPATVTEHVYRLRAKIEVDPTRPSVLCTVRGVGYRLDPPPRSSAARRLPRTGSGVQVGTRIVAVDLGALALFGATSPVEVVGRDMFDFVAPVSRPSARVRREIRAAGREPLDQLIMVRQLDGVELLVLMTTEPIDLAGDAGVRVTMEEVLDHRLGLTPDIGIEADYDADETVIVTDADFHILSWSQGAERCYGWLAPEVLGHSLDDLVPGQAYIESDVGQDDHSGPARWGYAARFTARDGSIVTTRVSMRPLCRADGSVDGIVMVHRSPCAGSPGDELALVAGFAGVP